MRLDDVTVVIPVLNEAKAIAKVLEEVIALGIPHDNIIVVDGGSTDETPDIARGYGVNVVTQKGRGKADAIKTALEYIKTPYLVVMDGDYTYPAKYIPVLLEKLRSRRCSFVIGARIYGKNAQKALFALGNKILTKFFNLLFGVNLSDVLSGMYASTTREFKNIGFEMKGFSVESEILAHFASLGTVCEEPIEYRKRLDPSAKKLKVFHGFRIAIDIVRLTWRYNPTFLVFMLGALLLAPGLTLGAWVGYHYLFTGVKYYVKGLIAIMLTLLGLVFATLAGLSLYLKRMEMRISRYIRELAEKIEKNWT